MYAQYMPSKALFEVLIGKKAERLSGVPVYKLYGMTACEELEQYGLTKRESEKMLAAIEIGKRLSSASTQQKAYCGDPVNVVKILMPLLRYKQAEEFWVLTLNVKHAIINMHTVTTGSLSNLMVHPRDIFSKAILDKASAIIVAHNHPSGDSNPSQEDKEVTKTIENAAKIMGIPLLDHIIIGDGNYYSFEESGFFKDTAQAEEVKA